MPDDRRNKGPKVGMSIERLSLQLSGLTESDGRRLALLITEGLAAAGLDDSLHYEIGTVRISVDAPPGGGMDRLSEQIVADILGQIRRTG